MDDRTYERFSHLYLQRVGAPSYCCPTLAQRQSWHTKNTFRNFRRSVYFIDKTMLIKRILEDKFSLILSPYVNLTKTNINMLQVFFEIVVSKDGEPVPNIKHTDNFQLFQKLSIGRHKVLFEKYCGKSPVIYVGLGVMPIIECRDVLEKYKLILSCTFSEHDYLRNSQYLGLLDKIKFDKYRSTHNHGNLTENDIVTGLSFLSEILYRHFKKEVVILIEHYDCPILEAICNNKKDTDRVVSITRNLFSNAFKWNKYVDRAVVTGTCYLSDVGIYVINNMEIYRRLQRRSLNGRFLNSYDLGCFKVYKTLQGEKFAEFFSISGEEQNRLISLPQLSYSLLDYGCLISRIPYVYPMRCVEIPHVVWFIQRLLNNEILEVVFVDKINTEDLKNFERLLLNPVETSEEHINLFLQLLCEMGCLTCDRTDDLTDVYKITVPKNIRWDIVCDPFQAAFPIENDNLSD